MAIYECYILYTVFSFIYPVSYLVHVLQCFIASYCLIHLSICDTHTEVGSPKDLDAMTD
jgi:hypothetical protein